MLRLRELRKKKGETQQDIADLLNVARASYTNIENGKRETNLETLTKLAKHFGVTVDYLICNSDNPSSPDQIKQITLEEFLEQQGITNKEYIQPIESLIELMKKVEHNQKLPNEIIKKA